MKRKTKKLAPIKEDQLAGRTVMVVGSPDGVLVRGVGNWNYTCPHCDALIADGIGRFQLQSVTVQCKCARYSAFPARAHDDA